MSPITIGIIAFVALVVVLFIGIPVSSAMGIVGVAGIILLLTPQAALTKMGVVPYETLSAYNYAVLPMFIMMAQVIAYTGVGEALYTAFYRLIGRFRGGLAMATVVACGIFSAISASVIATAMTIGMIALPEMLKRGYGPKLATGSIAAGGTLGVMIPPSGILIFYGIMTSQNITELFMAGVIPGIITVVMFCLVTMIICKRNPEEGPPAPKFTSKEIFQGLLGCIDILILIVLVLGGMFVGWFTPSEAGAIGAAGALLLTLLRRKLNWKNFVQALRGTLENTGMLYFILIGGQIMNYFMSVSGLPSALVNLVEEMHLSATAVVACIIVVYLFLGCFMDGLPMILLTIPVIYPLIQSVDIDPIWFGIIATFCLQMAVLTPPVGINVYVVKGLDDRIPIWTVFKGAFPFLCAQIVTVVLLMVFPQLVTWLPNLVT